VEVKGDDFTVSDFSGLTGLDYMWRIALECKRDTTVVPRAITLLSKTHEKLAEALRPQLATVRTAYIDAVMAKLKEYLANEKAVRITAKPSRLMDLLIACYSPSPLPSPHCSSSVYPS
jgi:hypothetical protein